MQPRNFAYPRVKRFRVVGTLADALVRRGKVSSSDVAECSANQDVRQEMLLRGEARHAYSCRERIHAPLKPTLLRISLSDHRRNCKSTSCMSGGKGFSLLPKLARAVCLVWPLAIRACLYQCV